MDEYSPQFEQGGQDDNNRPGAAINWDFIAGGAGTLTISLDGSDSSFPDTNPILNAFTLERDPGSSRPTEVHLDSGATTGTFTGADPGAGLDFTSTFLYAINVGAPGGQQIGDATFTSDDRTAGVTVVAQNVIAVWTQGAGQGAVDFGNTPADDALEDLMASIRWSASPTPLTITLTVTPGVEYRLQMMFHEQCCARGFDVFTDGVQIVDEYSPQRDQGGLTGGGRPGAFINYDFIPRRGEVTVELVGTDAAFADTNPM